MSWEEAAEAKRRQIEDSIPKEWRIEATPPDGAGAMKFAETSGLLTPEELRITTLSATDIVDAIANKQLTSVAVTTAFCKRAVVAQRVSNCFHEFFPDLALERARYLDEYLAQNGKTIGPLHGLPISLKDQFRIKGLETTMGYVSWIGKKGDKDSILVTLLLQAGAVLYVKTSVPQSLMIGETFNNIIGRTTNPRKSTLSSGGSSGGEGVIVALRGSIIGVGTDIGGSIRIPSAFNFLYGLRPSHGRLPYAGMANSMEGQESIHSVCGPLCHSVADMRLFVKSVLAEKPWSFDAKVVPLPWRQEEEDAVRAKIQKGGLTLAFYSCDGVVRPHPPILRGVQTVVDKVKGAGHTVMPWEPFNHSEAVGFAGQFYTADAGDDIRRVLEESGEPPIPGLVSMVNPSTVKLSVNEVWDVQLKRWEYQCDYLSALRELEETLGVEIDAIIAPVAATAAVRHDQYNYYGYTSVVNLLDFTSVVVPVTFADSKIDVRDESFKPLSELDEEVQAEYDPEAYHGAPVAVQIIGRRLTEERIMLIAEEVGKLLGNEIIP